MVLEPAIRAGYPEEVPFCGPIVFSERKIAQVFLKLNLFGRFSRYHSIGLQILKRPQSKNPKLTPRANGVIEEMLKGHGHGFPSQN